MYIYIYTHIHIVLPQKRSLVILILPIIHHCIPSFIASPKQIGQNIFATIWTSRTTSFANFIYFLHLLGTCYNVPWVTGSRPPITKHMPRLHQMQLRWSTCPRPALSENLGPSASPKLPSGEIIATYLMIIMIYLYLYIYTHMYIYIYIRDVIIYRYILYIVYIYTIYV